MGRTATGVIDALLLVAVVVAVDGLLFRDHPRRRLAAAVGIVLVSAAVYFRFPNHTRARRGGPAGQPDRRSAATSRVGDLRPLGWLLLDG